MTKELDFLLALSQTSPLLGLLIGGTVLYFTLRKFGLINLDKPEDPVDKLRQDFKAEIKEIKNQVKETHDSVDELKVSLAVVNTKLDERHGRH